MRQIPDVHRAADAASAICQQQFAPQQAPQYLEEKVGTGPDNIWGAEDNAFESTGGGPLDDLVLPQLDPPIASLLDRGHRRFDGRARCGAISINGHAAHMDEAGRAGTECFLHQIARALQHHVLVAAQAIYDMRASAECAAQAVRMENVYQLRSDTLAE